ncbi:FAD-dependent monooxygenase [Ramlibacter sp. MAHUQ-53]|uniref:FAD-dependent monooxygenase n=1 Tax=unclassified Ramlibacter TaxID=2617605 RepID=UPI00363E5DE1
MSRDLLVAGGGIAGLAAALAAVRAGWMARVFEQAPHFSEVGAGLQLGPNATRVLRAWDVLPLVKDIACAPRRLVTRDALTGREIASLPLGTDFERRYGAPYLTMHRADLHGALLQAVGGLEVGLHPGVRIAGFLEEGAAVGLRLDGREAPQADALAACDGLWSVARQQLLGDGPARPSDHVAYRGLATLADLPAPWQAGAGGGEVTAWLGPRLHAVTYPVRGGAVLNVVCVVQQSVDGERFGWDLPGTVDRLRAAMGPACARLQEALQAVPSWGLWVLHDRDPVAGAHQMALGRVALLGDAAHPMRPYLAQGAAMALEDAFELGRSLQAVTDRVLDVPDALQRYALGRWQRVARVQRRALRNGTIFHATGPVRLARDLALRGLGARLMDQPWLYG